MRPRGYLLAGLLALPALLCLTPRPAIKASQNNAGSATSSSLNTPTTPPAKPASSQRGSAPRSACEAWRANHSATNIGNCTSPSGWVWCQSRVTAQ